MQLHRERILVSKQVEQSVLNEHSADFTVLRLSMQKQHEMEVSELQRQMLVERDSYIARARKVSFDDASNEQVFRSCAGTCLFICYNVW